MTQLARKSKSPKALRLILRGSPGPTTSRPLRRMRRKTFSLCSKDNKHWAFKWRKVVTLGGGTANSEICLSGSTQRMAINIVLKSVFRALAVSPPCSKMGNGVWPSFCTTLIGQFDGLLAWFQRLIGLAYRCPNIHDVQPAHFSLLLTKPRPSVWVKSSYTFTQAASQDSLSFCIQ